MPWSGAVDAGTAEDDAELSPAFEKGFASIREAASIGIGNENVFRGHTEDNNVMVLQERILDHRQNGPAGGQVFQLAEVLKVALEFIRGVEGPQTTAEHVGWRADGGAGMGCDSNLAFAGSQAQVVQRGHRGGRPAGVVCALNTDAIGIVAGLESGKVSPVGRRSGKGPHRVERDNQRQKSGAEKPDATISRHAKQGPEQKNGDDGNERELGSASRNP